MRLSFGIEVFEKYIFLWFEAFRDVSAPGPGQSGSECISYEVTEKHKIGYSRELEVPLHTTTTAHYLLGCQLPGGVARWIRS